MHENVQPARSDRLCLGAAKFRMSTSSFRVWILFPSLTVFVALLALWPTYGRTDTTQAPGTESSAGGATDAWLVARGLIGRGMIGERSGSDVMTPPPGTEVDETRQKENRTGEVLDPGQVVERNGRRRHDPYRGDHPIDLSVRSRLLAVSQSSSGLHHVSMDAVRSWSRAAERVLA